MFYRMFKEILKLANKFHDDIKDTIKFIIGKLGKSKGCILEDSFSRYKPIGVILFDKREKFKVAWNIYGTKEILFEVVESQHPGISRLQIDSIWVGNPSCISCDCELQGDEKKWICVNCGRKVKIPKYLRTNMQENILRVFKAILNQEKIIER